MTWKCYLTIFKALSPIHIGYKQIGNLKTTRYYIMGKTIWGAITASLTRALFEKPTFEDYIKVGGFVKECIKTTYFYPAIEKSEVKKPEELSKIEVSNYLVFLPEYTNNGLRFGELSKEEFEQIFVGSFVSTSLEVSTKAAEEGSLHEFEFVSNKVKIGSKIHNVYWIGYLFIKQGVESNGLKIIECRDDKILIESVNNNTSRNLIGVLNSIQVGGERNYGFGKMRLQNSVREAHSKIFGRWNFELDDDVILKNSNVAVAHVILNEAFELELGEIEPVIGLEWTKEGPGQKPSNGKVCITPGSKFKKRYDFEIREYGVLEVI